MNPKTCKKNAFAPAVHDACTHSCKQQNLVNTKFEIVTPTVVSFKDKAIFSRKETESGILADWPIKHQINNNIHYDMNNTRNLIQQQKTELRYYKIRRLRKNNRNTR